jgi:hypothetical protein
VETQKPACTKVAQRKDLDRVMKESGQKKCEEKVIGE